MKKLINFLKQDWDILAIFALILVVVIIANTCGNLEQSEPIVLYRENPELQKINSELKNQIFKSESKILILETKIETLEKTKNQQSWNLVNSTENLETEVVEVVKIVQDSTLIILLDRVKFEQKSLVKTYENIITLKDSVIFEKDNLVKSYVFATDKMSNEIEKLHAENNELIINNSKNKGKIKKRNRIIVVGSAIVVAGIATAILIKK